MLSYNYSEDTYVWKDTAHVCDSLHQDIHVHVHVHVGKCPQKGA